MPRFGRVFVGELLDVYARNVLTSGLFLSTNHEGVQSLPIVTKPHHDGR